MVLIAIDPLDIGGGPVQRAFLVALAGVVLALAFGPGDRDWAADLLAR